MSTANTSSNPDLAAAIEALPPRFREAAELLECARNSDSGIAVNVADPKMIDRMREYLWRAHSALRAKGFDHYRHLAVLRENGIVLHIVRRDRIDALESVCISDSIRNLQRNELPNRVQHARGPRPRTQPEAYARYAENLLKGLKRTA